MKKSTMRKSNVVGSIIKMADAEKNERKVNRSNKSEIKEAKDYNKHLWSEKTTEEHAFDYQEELDKLIDSGVVSDLHVYLAHGNKKTGSEVPSISLLPVVDCGNCECCKRGCYDMHHDVIYTSCRKYRLINSAIYRTDPDRFWKEVGDLVKYNNTIRFNIGGDIKDMRYMQGLVELAESRTDMKILLFTKMFDIVNEWIKNHNGCLPMNLKIMFSAWAGLEIPNPYQLPLCTIVLPDGKSFDETGKATDLPVDYLCDGNCTICNNDCKGCWVARRGSRVGINFHG